MTATNLPNGIRAPLLGPGETETTAIVDLTDNSGGTGSDTIAVIGGTYDQAEVANAIASLSDKITELNAALQASQVTAS
jgi:hypothetical protein